MTPITINIKGSVRKQVTCESCGHQYGYEMTRIGTGTDGGFARNQKEGEEKASYEAAADLREKLRTDCDVVHCPQCGAITRQMKRTAVGNIFLFLVLMLLGGIMAVVAYNLYHWTHHFRFWIILGGGASIIAFLGGLIGVLATLDELWGRGKLPNNPSATPDKKDKVQEICQRLIEFHPDSDTREKLLHDFAHNFLPHYVHQNPHAFFSYLYRPEGAGDAMDPTRFIQSRWAMFERKADVVPRPHMENMVFRRVTDLSMSLHQIAGMPVTLIQMPVPEAPLEAFFIGVVLLAPAGAPEAWTADVRVRIFTLEAEMDWQPGGTPKGMLCEWVGASEHRCLGMIVAAETDAFLQVMAEMLTAPGEQITVGFTPPKAGQPAQIIFSNASTANQPVPRPSKLEPDEALKEMLTSPQPIPGQTFSREHYLLRVALGWIVAMAKSMDIKDYRDEIYPDAEDACSVCMRLRGMVVWVFDLEARNESGKSGRELFIERAKPRGTQSPAAERRACLERILDRCVFRIELEAVESHSSGSSSKHENFRTVGCYVAGLEPQA